MMRQCINTVRYGKKTVDKEGAMDEQAQQTEPSAYQEIEHPGGERLEALESVLEVAQQADQYLDGRVVGVLLEPAAKTPNSASAGVLSRVHRAQHDA